jgi:4-amino-4-deoxy-L-arabinose transferase-like glycosyltransferase
MPGLVQVLLTGATAALLFLFAARLVGRWTAFVGTALWISAPINSIWRAGYFSETLTGFLWIAWSWLAWRYRRDGRPRDLVFAAVLVALAGITRPITGIVLALPLILVLWPRLRAPGGCRDAALAVAVALPVCAVVPIWNHAVLDSWSTVPYAEYSARTFPFDMPTLDTDWSPSPRELPPDFEALGAEQRRHYVERRVSDMPLLFFARLDGMASAALPADLGALRYLAPLGLLAAGGAGWVALASVLLLVLGHLTMPHEPGWTVYYLEVFPLVALGAVIAVTRAAGTAVRATIPRAPELASTLRHAPWVGLAAGVLLLGLAATAWEPNRRDISPWMQAEIDFRSGVCSLPPGDKIVFVRRRPDWSPHHSLVDNDPRWRTSDAWVVRAWTTDRQRALMEAAPDRSAYLFDAMSGWFVGMGRDGMPGSNRILHVLDTDRRLGRGIECP